MNTHNNDATISNPSVLPAPGFFRRLRTTGSVVLVAGMVRRPLALVSLVVFFGILLAVAAAPILTPFAPDESTGRFAQAPSSSNWIGTDHLGRDVLTRLLYGGRVSLGIGLASVSLGLVVGAVVGMISGYSGGVTDMLMQRVVDILMAIPNILLALTIVAAFGASSQNVVLAIAAGIAPRSARVVRASAIAIRAQPYVEAAQSLGATPTRVVARHIFPNITAPIIVLASIQLGAAIIVEASLSFLGLGVPLNVPTWGNMLSGSGLTYMVRAPWMAVAPGLALTAVVMSLNLLGDSLRDLLDPRLRGGARGIGS